MRIASRKACSEAFRSRTRHAKLSSQTSAGRAIQSHVTVSPLNSRCRSRKGARESSPKRISLRSPRTKSATSQNGFIPAPFFSQRGSGPRRQSEENHELTGNDGFQNRGHTRLQTYGEK